MVEEWSALLGSTLSKMALVRGTDSPDAYLPEDCYPVIEKMFQAAMDQARAEGNAAAIRDIQQGAVRQRDATGVRHVPADHRRRARGAPFRVNQPRRRRMEAVACGRCARVGRRHSTGS